MYSEEGLVQTLMLEKRGMLEGNLGGREGVDEREKKRGRYPEDAGVAVKWCGGQPVTNT